MSVPLDDDAEVRAVFDVFVVQHRDKQSGLVWGDTFVVCVTDIVA